MPVKLANLRKILLLRELSEDELLQMSEIIEKVEFSKGDYLFRQGDSSDAFYIVLKGEMSVTKDLDKKEVHITNVSTGSIIGEMGFITDSPRTATIKALSEVEMLKIPKDEFNKFLDEGNLAAYKLIYRLSYTLCFRLARMSEKLVTMVVTEDEPEKEEKKESYIDCIKRLFSR